jgi:hypothetical protein
MKTFGSYKAFMENIFSKSGIMSHGATQNREFILTYGDKAPTGVGGYFAANEKMDKATVSESDLYRVKDLYTKNADVGSRRGVHVRGATTTTPGSG